MIQEHNSIPDTLRDLYERHHHQNTAPALEEVIEITKSLIPLYDDVVLVIDALDECGDEIRWELIEVLRQYQLAVHIMITSRSLETIEEELEDFAHLSIKAHKSDIEIFIDDQIQRNKNLRKAVQKNPTLRADIKQRVVETAEHM